MNWLKYREKNIIKIFPVLILAFLFWADYSLAATAYTLEMPLPGVRTTSDPGQYIQALFKLSFYLIAFLAVAMITYGGILYMVPSKISEAKERIWGAVIGVIFLLCSFLILQTIDPNLLKLSPSALPSAGTTGEAYTPGGKVSCPTESCPKFQTWDSSTCSCVVDASY